MEFEFKIKIEKEDLQTILMSAMGLFLGVALLGSIIFNGTFAISKFMGLI